MIVARMVAAMAIVVASWSARPAMAQDETASPKESGWASATFEDMGFDDSTRAYNTRPTYTFYFNTRGDEVLTDARLTLDVAESNGNWEGIRGLQVLVNDEEVANLDVTALTQKPRHAVAIDSRLLSDKNSLTLKLLQVTEQECNDSVPKAKWELIRNGVLETRGSPLPLLSDLAILPLPFYDPLNDRQATIPVVIYGEPDTTTLQAASLVANWFGLLTGSRVHFPVTLGTLPTTSAVVLTVGDQGVSDLGIAPADGPKLRMVDHPAAPGSNRKLLVLQGNSPADLVQVAKGLLLADAAPTGPSWSPGRVPEPPVRNPYDAPRWLPPRDTVSFKDIIGDEPLVHDGLSGGSMELTFRVAPDLFTWPRDLLRLDIDYQQSAPSQELIPTVIVELNGRYVTTLPRQRPDAGSSYRTVQLDLHRSQIRGFNRLQFHVAWGNDDDLCDPLLGADVETTILPSSTIYFQRTPHFAQLPNVESFVEDGYPFTRMADLSETAVILPDDVTAPEIGTLLSLMAHFAAVTGSASFRADIHTVSEVSSTLPKGKDLLVIGDITHPPLWSKIAPDLPVDIQRSRLVARAPTWERQALDVLGGHLTGQQADELARLLLSHREVAAVVGAPAPTGHDRSLVLVTAATPDAMPAIDDMIGFARATVPGGDVLVIADGERTRFRIGGVYHLGEVDWFTRLRWMLAMHWLVLIPGLLLGVLLVSAVWRNALTVQEQRRLAQASGES